MELPKEFFYYAALLKGLCIELESITFNDGTITVSINKQGERLRKQRITKKFVLKEKLNQSNILHKIEEKEIEIKQLRDAFEITNYGSLTKIHISDNNSETSPSEYVTTTYLMNNEFNKQDFEEQLSLLSQNLSYNDPVNNEFNIQEQPSLLNQILNELSCNDPDEVWIHINSRLKGIFGYNKILNSSNNEYRKYLNLIFKLQNCELLKPYKELIELWVSKATNTFGTLKNDQTLLSTQIVASANKVSSAELNDDQRVAKKNSSNEHLTRNKLLKVADKLRKKISTSNNIIIESNVDKESNLGTIKQNLVEWYKKYNEFGKNKIEKLKHFVSVKHHYNNLLHAATQEMIIESNSLNNRQKASANIPLGKNPPPKILRGYITHFISSTINIFEKYERNIWNAVNLLVTLLSNGVNYESLIEAGATANFF
ncbi:16098_t:CDS:2, partial [Gigaspora margarita]